MELDGSKNSGPHTTAGGILGKEKIYREAKARAASEDTLHA